MHLFNLNPVWISSFFSHIHFVQRAESERNEAKWKNIKLF